MVKDLGTRYIVDENGEVLSEIKTDQYCQIRSLYSSVKYKESDALNYKFLKVNPLAMRECCIKYSLFPHLLPLVHYFDNYLMFSNGRPVKTSSLNAMCNISLHTIRKQIREMIDDDILRKTKVGGVNLFVMNPWICMKGKRIYGDTSEMFRYSKWKAEREEKPDEEIEI